MIVIRRDSICLYSKLIYLFSRPDLPPPWKWHAIVKPKHSIRIIVEEIIHKTQTQKIMRVKKSDTRTYIYTSREKKNVIPVIIRSLSTDTKNNAESRDYHDRVLSVFFRQLNFIAWAFMKSIGAYSSMNSLINERRLNWKCLNHFFINNVSASNRFSWELNKLWKFSLWTKAWVPRNIKCVHTSVDDNRPSVRRARSDTSLYFGIINFSWYFWMKHRMHPTNERSDANKSHRILHTTNWPFNLIHANL